MPIVELPETCEGCGCCCWLTVVLDPKKDTGVPAEMSFTWIDDDGREIQMKRNDDGFCVALSRLSGKCTIYDDRPSVCREYWAGCKSCFEAMFQAKHGMFDGVMPPKRDTVSQEKS